MNHNISHFHCILSIGISTPIICREILISAAILGRFMLTLGTSVESSRVCRREAVKMSISCKKSFEGVGFVAQFRSWRQIEMLKNRTYLRKVKMIEILLLFKESVNRHCRLSRICYRVIMRSI